MRLGICLPSFTSDPSRPLAVARMAEVAGLAGVFCFDHLFPIGHPDRPSLALLPMLGAVAAVTETVRVGSLVARVGMRPRAELVAAFTTLAAIAPSRVIAGLGTGDRLSRPEAETFGLPFGSVDERVGELSTTVDALKAEGIETWVAGRHPKVLAVAARADGWNLWNGDAAELLRLAPGRARLTWGGDVRLDAEGVVGVWDKLRRLEAAGVDWAICAAPASADWQGLVECLAAYGREAAGTVK